MYYLNGKRFETEALYLDEWLRVSKKFEEMHPYMKVTGFSPGVSVRHRKDASYSASLPEWLIFEMIGEAQPVEPPRCTYKDSFFGKIWPGVFGSDATPAPNTRDMMQERLNTLADRLSGGRKEAASANDHCG